MTAYKGYRVRDAVTWLLASQRSHLLRYISLQVTREEMGCAAEQGCLLLDRRKPRKTGWEFHRLLAQDYIRKVIFYWVEL